MLNDNQFSQFLSGSTWTGAVVGGVGALTMAQWLAIGGFMVALAGFFVNLWHKRQMLKIERERLSLEFPQSEEN